MSSDQNGNRTWQLSAYERERKPQEIISNNEEIAVSPRSLHSELMCPICLDMLKNTMTTKECLHRFCQDCITTALRNGNKECPTCRKKLVSKRSLRHDPNFDELISKIYPNRDDYDALQERTLAKINRKNYDDSNCETDNKKSENAEDEQLIGRSKDQDVELIFKPIIKPLDFNNDEVNSDFLQVRYIKTTINATIDHLVRYITMRHKIDCNPENNEELMKDANNEESLFTIYQAGELPSELKPLSGNITLKQIASEKFDSFDKYKKLGKPLELHYGYKM